LGKPCSKDQSTKTTFGGNPGYEKSMCDSCHGDDSLVPPNADNAPRGRPKSGIRDGGLGPKYGILRPQRNVDQKKTTGEEKKIRTLQVNRPLRIYVPRGKTFPVLKNKRRRKKIADPLEGMAGRGEKGPKKTGQFRIMPLRGNRKTDKQSERRSAELRKGGGQV